MKKYIPDLLSIPEMQPMDIAIRAYVCKADFSTHKSNIAVRPKKYTKKKNNKPSIWTLVFDTETTTDAAQALRFGAYQIRKNESLIQSGIFYDLLTLKESEKALLKKYADENELTLLAVEEFIENVFYGVGYKYRASIVGINLPFDISRLAIDHCTARITPWNKIMRGGFSFQLSKNTWNPRVQIKHVSSRDSFIQFSATYGQRTNRPNRKKKRWEPVRRGFFLDIKTLAAALTSQSHSLESLAKTLGVATQKHGTNEHGRALTESYIDYAVQDTQATWECFVKLKNMYELHGLDLTAPHQIHSEASLGKAYLREMGIQPWRRMQPDFPPGMIGKIMSTYYGGRSEVHIRRDISQVLYCDFLSMYPTVCTLMNLWRFVTAQGMASQDTTDETRQFLDKITVSDLQNPETWKLLCTIVKVRPNGDIFPVRAKYGDEDQYTIGTNHLTSETPLWFTLADCISAKLLTGRAPEILEAISFKPKAMQEGLVPVNISGNDDYRVDPSAGDFFKRVIDLRTTIRKKIKTTPPEEKHIYESQQLALKILANSTSYGIFVELNVEEEKQLQALSCCGVHDESTLIYKKKFEAPGSFFHPLLATLITGGARLMLAMTERLACDAGLDWAFCDTDSMALAKPDAMPEDEFYKLVKEVQESFMPLNPYAEKAPLLKIEDYNYSASDGSLLQPLYCYAISSKRYALFNWDQHSHITLRKVSAHGLGHLIAPYQSDHVSRLEDILPWQQDFWLKIIRAELDGSPNQPDFESMPNFNRPAISRYGATTPALIKWFEKHNQHKSYRDRVRPFNFLLAMQGKRSLQIRPVSPFNKNHRKALTQCFDRMTGQAIKPGQLKSYMTVLAQYHLHPETKFLNGEYLDKGKTQRRHISVEAIQHIGKEANKWEEQYFVGYDPDAQIEYGFCDEQRKNMLTEILQSITEHGIKNLAAISKLSDRHISKIYKTKIISSDKTLAKLHSSVKILQQTHESRKILRKEIKEAMRLQNISIRLLAEKMRVDPSNLAKILSEKRQGNDSLFWKMKKALL